MTSSEWEEHIAKIVGTSETSSIDSFVGENYRFRHDACEYLLDEVEYGLRLCECAEKEAHSGHYELMTVRLNGFKDALHKLSGHLQAAFIPPASYRNMEPFKSGRRMWYNRAFLMYTALIDSSLSLLGKSINDALTSTLNRRYKRPPVSVQSPGDAWHIPFRLADSHLEYSDTFRGVEGILTECFGTIADRMIPDAKKLPPPILVVARGPSFSFEFFDEDRGLPIFMLPDPPGADGCADKVANDDWEYFDMIIHALELVESDENMRKLTSRHIKDVTAYLSNVLMFSRVVTPRYFPVMIRYSPLLIHELFHSFQWLSEQVTTQYNELMSDEANVEIDVRPEERAGEFNEVFGPGLIEFDQTYNSLRASIEDFLPVLAHRLALAGSKLNTIDIMSKFVTENVAAKLAKELISDLGALVVGHQAYAAALVYHSFVDGLVAAPDRVRGDKLIDDHPAHIVRAEVMIQLLYDMGFENSSESLREKLKETIYSTKMGCYHENYWDIWDKLWWSLETTQRLIRKSMREFQRMFKPSLLYVACFSETIDAPFGFRYDETLLEGSFDLYLSKIENNEVVWDDGPGQVKELGARFQEYFDKEVADEFTLQPSDLTNIMWYHMINDKQVSNRRLRLQWRLTLKHLARRVL